MIPGMRTGVRALAVGLAVVSAATVVPSAVDLPGAPAGAASRSGAVTPVAAAKRSPEAVRLKELGCFIQGARSGGIRMRAATIRFQAANGLGQSGELTARTLKRLSSAEAIACDDRPVPARTGSGRRIVMSQGQNWLWLVKADGAVAAQGGVVDNDWLPQRTYVTGEQCGRPGRARYRSDPTGGLSIDYFVRFADCTVGFHQIPVARRTDRQIHPDYLAGTDLRESRGCIRLPRPLIKHLWKFTKHDTKVVVTR